jgi:hypothetical protein
MSKRQPRDPNGTQRCTVATRVDATVYGHLAGEADAAGVTLSNHMARLLSAGIAPAPIGRQPPIKHGSGILRETLHTSVESNTASVIRELARARGMTVSSVVADILKESLHDR